MPRPSCTSGPVVTGIFACMPPPPLSIWQRFQRLAPYFGHQRPLWLGAGTATLVAASTEPLIPALLQPLLDRGFQQGGVAIWMVPVCLLLLFGIRGIAGFTAQLALAKIANTGMFRLRQALMNRVLHAQLSLFTQQSASTLANTLVYEVQTGATQLVGAILTLVRDSLTLLALLAYLMYLNPKLTVIVGLLFPAVAWVMKTLSRRLYSLTRSGQSATDALAYVVEENVLAHRVIRLHGAQAAQAERFDTLSRSLQRLAIKSTAASAAMTPLTQLLAAAALSAVISVALWQSTSSGVSVGEFAAFVTAMLMLVAPIKHLSDVANPITRGLAALERGLDLIETTPAEQGGTHAPQTVRGEIQLRQVSVRYAEDKPHALRSIDLHIQPGEVVALVGPSGSGKTTLANLLPRFVEASAGTIELDNEAIQNWDLQRLRQQFALVSQDVVMLNDSWAANVCLGLPLNEQRVFDCLEAANLKSHLSTLPEGIHAPVGHNANQLSGGQRQRLAIARAMYRNAPILILDEATSALDTESERLVQDAIGKLMAGRTTLIIAHRLSTIEHADRIVVMAQGEIVECGTHHDLVERNGLYARLHQLGFQDT